MSATKTEITEALQVNRKLDSLTKAARTAYGTYSRAEGRRTGRVQSTGEVKARAAYQTKQSELSQFCRDNGIKTPKTN